MSCNRCWVQARVAVDDVLQPLHGTRGIKGHGRRHIRSSGRSLNGRNMTATQNQSRDRQILSTAGCDGLCKPRRVDTAISAATRWLTCMCVSLSVMVSVCVRARAHTSYCLGVCVCACACSSQCVCVCVCECVCVRVRACASAHASVDYHRAWEQMQYRNNYLLKQYSIQSL